MRTRHFSFAASLAFIVAACGSTPEDVPDTGDAAADVTADATDTAVDTAPDSDTADVAPDVAPDVPSDASVDTIEVDTAADAGSAAYAVCVETGGAWDPAACGHYVCGVPNDCDAVIPGCDCGAGHSFDDALGCVEDPTCAPKSDEALCVETDGEWRTDTCSHWACGQPPACLALIPGCQCGDNEVFVDGQGCREDASCYEDGEQLCADTGGDWYSGCGPTVCGEAPPIDCFVAFNACDCGPGLGWDDERGCVLDESCDHEPSALCEDTGGRWSTDACPYHVCGEPDPTAGVCDEGSFGCACGDDSTFDFRVGCVSDLACDACPDPRDPDVQIVADNAEDCAVIDYMCDEGYDGWSDPTCGCGCVRAE